MGTSRITINTTITALRFFFEVTVGDKNIVGKLKTVPVPRKLPMVLSREEVSRLLEATSSLKYKAAFSVAYGAGLRMNEVTTLKVSDIDGERKTLHVEQGKGRKDRYAILAAAADAGIDKRVTLHLPRHSFATHLLEQKVDIRLIQVLLGHSKLETTRLYAQVATDILQEVTGPLEILPIPT